MLLAIPMAVVIQVFVKEVIIKDILEKIIFLIKPKEQNGNNYYASQVSVHKEIPFSEFLDTFLSFKSNPFTPYRIQKPRLRLTFRTIFNQSNLIKF